MTEEGYRFEGEMQQASMTEEDYLTEEMLEDAERNSRIKSTACCSPKM